MIEIKRYKSGITITTRGLLYKKKRIVCAQQKQRKAAGAECLTLIALVMGLFAVNQNFSEINAAAKKRCKKFNHNCSISAKNPRQSPKVEKLKFSHHNIMLFYSLQV